MEITKKYVLRQTMLAKMRLIPVLRKKLNMPKGLIRSYKLKDRQQWLKEKGRKVKQWTTKCYTELSAHGYIHVIYILETLHVIFTDAVFYIVDQGLTMFYLMCTDI